MKSADRFGFVVGLVLFFGGLNLLILLSHLGRFWGIPIMLAGLGLLVWTARGMESTTRPRGEANIASRLVHIITFRGRFRDLLPIAGIGVLVTVLAFNLLVAERFYLGSNDYVALVLAGALIAYNLVPRKYAVERDFALLFSILLFVFLVLPTTALELTSQGEDTNSPITYYLLAMPASALVRLFGIPVISPFYEAPGLPVYNMMEITGPDGPIMLSISLSCSGLYSVAIFTSAFIAFVAVEYKRFDRRVAGLLIVGLLLAWIANLIRMALIIIVGYYRGAGPMVWTHNYAGEFIFMGWVTLFWWFMFRYFGVLETREVGKLAGKPRRKCPICGERLSPTMPSAKCECGAISHSSCLLSEGMRCPECGVRVEVDRNGEPGLHIVKPKEMR